MWSRDARINFIVIPYQKSVLAKVYFVETPALPAKFSTLQRRFLISQTLKKHDITINIKRYC